VSALDVSVQAEVLNLLAELKDRLGLTMMFISHDLSVVEIVSDRVMVLYLGRIMEIGPTADVYRHPQHPYTAALLSAAPGQPAQRKPIVLQGEIPSPSNPPSGCVFRTRCPFAISDCAARVPALSVVAPQHLKACIRDDIEV
jgi:oligopeptide/dipeptide ABC transporter ATP-binding protein